MPLRLSQAILQIRLQLGALLPAALAPVHSHAQSVWRQSHCVASHFGRRVPLRFIAHNGFFFFGLASDVA
jgi:hypothetical protein